MDEGEEREEEEEEGVDCNIVLPLFHMCAQND